MQNLRGFVDNEYRFDESFRQGWLELLNRLANLGCMDSLYFSILDAGEDMLIPVYYGFKE